MTEAQPLTALIVDDNPRNVAVLARLLQEQAIAARIVNDPRQLDAVLTQAPQFALMFVDLEMPGLSGFEVLERIKANPNFADVPVIAYTVHISEMHEAHQQGFDGFIGKPIDPDKFTEQLDRILNGSSVWETK